VGKASPADLAPNVKKLNERLTLTNAQRIRPLVWRYLSITFPRHF
jgi:hypothetical protein